jgi:uncharacterized membrane protein YsdA (DUF1294 family)/cold shock CspA family protein
LARIGVRGTFSQPGPSRPAAAVRLARTLCLTKYPPPPMRFEGTLTSWNDDRGFGRIESTQGGEPIFVHVSAWPRGGSRPKLNQAVSFEVELGPKGKRARNVQLIQSRRTAHRPERNGPAQWGTATLFVIPAFLVVYVVVAAVWKLPLWVAGMYLALSAATFVTYAADKSAASSGAWRTPESTLHGLALAGGWPGALLAQQFLRHKSAKREFRQVFWATVILNMAGFLVLASPLRQSLLQIQ